MIPEELEIMRMAKRTCTYGVVHKFEASCLSVSVPEF